LGFSYDKIKAQEESGNQWTSYSDLFMALSFIFLLLYVTASLKSEATNFSKRAQSEAQAHEIAELKEQLTVYETLKKDYLEQKATPKDQKIYQDLMSKLSLLQEESRKEKEGLRQKAQRNEEKEMALNHYQKLIRNIINANVISQTKIKRARGYIFVATRVPN